MLATCYGTSMPKGYRPEILSARASADRWWALTTTIDKFNREFCWPQHRIQPASTLWSAGHAPPSNKEREMCVWVVAWMFMCGCKGMKHASDSEKLAAISVGGVLQLPRFGVLGMHDRNFNISPDWGLNQINSGSKVCISTIGGRHEGYQLVALQRSTVPQLTEKKKKALLCTDPWLPSFLSYSILSYPIISYPILSSFLPAFLSFTGSVLIRGFLPSFLPILSYSFLPSFLSSYASSLPSTHPFNK